MPRYYCDYCDTYLTHDSPSVRKQHNAGYKHKANVRTYYQQFEEQLSQVLIDQRIKEHLGQTAAIQQVGAAFNQHLASFPPRPGHSILSTPVMPVMGASQGPPFLPLAQGIRPPIMPRPVAGAPGYVAAPVVAPPGAPSMSMQVNGLQGPPTMIPSTTQGGSTVPSSNGAQTLNAPALYQANSATPTNASPGLQMPAPPTSIGSQDGFSYSQASDTNH